MYHELRVPDVAAAAMFYGELFGWTAVDTPTGKLFRAGDTVIGGVSAVKPHVPPHWSGYVAVDDVTATLTGAKEHGGIVTTDDGEPIDAPGHGLLAPVLDTVNKAVFVVTGPRPVTNGPKIGTFVWDRLHTADPTASVAFYQKVLPWTAILNSDGSSGGFRLTDGTMAADMVPAGQDPSRWLAFVLVEDLDRIRTKANDLGAHVLVRQESFPGDSGDFSVIADPQGAEIGFCQTS
ncbi:hypothetical protein ALI144C_07270 [Actinosynnema sp. ALI-1.44]|uniref:VOC family protein n=1 Tax=Actinosynnema sp. ALI-1.44 TaxID=1933779 RepID=UPI00097CBB8F|nr:VOC family protein [Actinosynnema sp. ALI-1.44]ONI88241.1 hypothetical protein ALI144C_07270 [Actinosynnema sp. ALI-1.44]